MAVAVTAAVIVAVNMTVVKAMTIVMLMSVPVVMTMAMPVTVPVTVVAEEQGRNDIQKKAGAGSSEDAFRTRYDL